ncbi:MAG: hypothetical protein JNK58_03130 [Phycisphaerae bacterium]|nr:hypothetical protein [Phycisphaerae bacterium]
MLSFRAPRRATLLGAVLLVSLLPALTLGCANKRPPARPSVLVSPYPAGREIVLAVAPLRNESGVSFIDELALSDTLVNEAQAVEGITILPVNRTLGAMRALKIATVSSQSDALAVCKTLGIDGLIVGTVHAWHPYDPPIIGMSLSLFGMDDRLRAPAAIQVDARSLRSAVTDLPVADAAIPAGPLSAQSAVLDASDGNTRALIRGYAEGRHDPDSALGWRRYTASMALYAKFACHEMTRRLLESERARLRGLEARSETGSAR